MNDDMPIGTACKGGRMMGVEERIAALEEEIQQLREDKERLMNIITQMKSTLNRLIGHYISESR